MNERIKQIRLALGMSQEQFGKRLSVTRSAISYLESGRSKLTDRMLFSICYTYDINKDWLLHGTGSMFASHTVDEELAAYMGKMLAEDNPEKEKIALIALKLIVDEWDLVKENLNTLEQILKWISDKPGKSQLPK